MHKFSAFLLTKIKGNKKVGNFQLTLWLLFCRRKLVLVAIAACHNNPDFSHYISSIVYKCCWRIIQWLYFPIEIYNKISQFIQQAYTLASLLIR